ncbi:MAG: hypothetical protein S4CHLAM102_09990 [Chlamydiia bacterium]|nr:hypothetical protein [Chlamydiia bacterium]
MKKKNLLPMLMVGLASLLPAASHAKDNPSIAVVNFGTCVQESKYGIEEQANFKKVEADMRNGMEDLDRQLSETLAKLQDNDYLDSLSPEAEEALKVKYQNLSEEFGRYQNQFYQVMQAAQAGLFRSLQQSINAAAEEVAKKDHIDVVLNKEMAFAISPSLDITSKVITQMNKNFDADAKNTKVNSLPVGGAK